MTIITESLIRTQLRYVNISWCKLTSGSLNDLSLFIRGNNKLEKLLLQHNCLTDAYQNKHFFNALCENISLKYLDLSANNMQADNLKVLLDLQSRDKLKLENLQYRKNKVDGHELHSCFRKLQFNNKLRVLNLQDNFITNENAEEIREFWAEKNIFAE